MNRRTTIAVDKAIARWREDPAFVAEYEALANEFSLADALIRARAESQLTQDEVARRMGTSRTAVARLESGRGNPSLDTLRRYAAATGRRLRITLDASDQSGA